MYQPRLFQRLGTRFPSTRYQGSKAKLVNWIWTQIRELDFGQRWTPLVERALLATA